MGAYLSVCCRRHHPVIDMHGNQIDVAKDFEEFTESDELLSEINAAGSQKPLPDYSDNLSQD
ncbi:ORF38 [Ovine gammaherpesvirus 2]|uniref:Cytoplasmic envelopment protein 3 n=1 Tax=Ovine gammaherpesvirus 2 TaxID=10398 RepID=Q2VSK3_9GAMA|nr:ORF38 [Ovine gammaherpesvirus 2]AAX58073.1 ORF38 [Ovine gammaherpesvirus 2]ABB22255.1 hypothetical protein OvHV-2gp35 [Ovine gammaherpesvirus 2]WOZ69482.1 ORF38 cytoplasmic egress tegument protein [Ovine gammaherpesvirus 2]